MEYCELGDLSYFIRKRDKLGDNPALADMVQKYPMPFAGGLNEVVARHFLKQLASAMEFLREHDYIHRDVKPQNLLLLPSPQFLIKSKYTPLVMSASNKSTLPIAGLTSLPMLKLADFGFARTLPQMSLAETLCGSPLYMAPEILRYEKYGPKADLWSIGTVLFEMMVGKPPFRASNHVELLRKIEQSPGEISFPKNVEVSSGMKEIINGLLRKEPEKRIAFEDFFNHIVVVGPIPNLVGDDRPAEIRNPRVSDDRLVRQTSLRGVRRSEPQQLSSSPRDQPPISSSPRIPNAEATGFSRTPPRQQAPARPTSNDQRRPPLVQATTTPMPITHPPKTDRQPVRDQDNVKRLSKDELQTKEEADEAVRDAREYVLVEKRFVEVNALADEMAANPGMGIKQPPPSNTGQIVRRATSQGAPASTTGAVPSSPSRAVQIAKGKPRQDAAVPQRQNSYGRSYGSPSATSAIAKAIHGASVRVFGVGWSPHLIGKGVSPPQLYSPFPAYPTPQTIGLLSDTKPSGPVDEDQRAVNMIEESATRSDVVYGFAEVKYKQLIPLAPSMDHGLGGPVPEKSGESIDDDGLTVEAIVALSEEALVLYVKALSLLAKSMDYASGWWAQKSRGEVVGTGQRPRSNSSNNIAAGNRINSAVQWVRSRFNEVLEKAEFVRLKLIEAQKQLPEDHPGHPSNHATASRLAGGPSSSSDGVVLSSGITAEKLMYDRALEMSRTAAINELTSEDFPGCEISYVTAIRMLEAVLETDEEVVPHRKRSSSLKDDSTTDEKSVNGINPGDRQDVLKGMCLQISFLCKFSTKSNLY